MSKLIILIGLPGAGKSTYAHKLMEIDKSSRWFSSDVIRKELYGDESIQGDPNKVFQVLHQRVRTYLTTDTTVIYDATNVNRKSRKQIISIAKSLCVPVEAHIVWCPYEVCVARDLQRGRTVGEEVIKKFIYRWETPYYDEGIDPIKVINTYDNFNKKEYVERMLTAMNIPHDNPHHSLGVLEHCNEASTLAMKRFDDPVIMVSALWHDIGKPMTKFYASDSTDVAPHAHYYSHHNVGGYLVIGCLDYDTDTKFVVDVSWLVTNHMEPFFNSTYYKTRSGVLKDRIDGLHSCDLDAH